MRRCDVLTVHNDLCMNEARYRIYPGYYLCSLHYRKFRRKGLMRLGGRILLLTRKLWDKIKNTDAVYHLQGYCVLVIREEDIKRIRKKRRVKR